MADIGISIGLTGASQYTNQLNRVTRTTTTQTGQMDSSFRRVRGGISEVATQVPGLGRALSALINPITAIAGAAVGLGTAFSRAVSTARTFQQQLADVAAVRGIQRTSEEFAKLEDFARELGATTVFSATQAAQGFEELARAGQDVNEILATAPNALNLATVGNISLARSAELATDVLNQFRKGAEESGRVVDVLAKTSTTSSTTIEQIGEAFKFLGPTAAALGVELEEVAAVTGILANNGLKGSIATRALGTSLVNLARPTAKAATEIEKIGLNAFDSQGNFVGLAGLVDQLQGAFAGYTDEQKQASLATIFGAEAIQEFNILLAAGSGEISDYTAELRAAGDSQGEFARQVAETRLDSFEGSLKLLSSAWEELQLTIASGSLDFLSGATTSLANGIRNVASIINGQLNFEDVLGPLGKQFDDIRATITGVFEDIAEATEPLRTAFRESFGDGAGFIQSIFLPSITAISAALKALRVILQPIVAAFSSFAASILPDLRRAFDSVRSSISEIVVAFRSILPGVSESSRELKTFLNAVLLPLRLNLKIVAGLIRVLAKAFEVAFKKIADQAKVITGTIRLVRVGLEQLFSAASKEIKIISPKEAANQGRRAGSAFADALAQANAISNATAGRQAEKAYAEALRNGIATGSKEGTEIAGKNLAQLKAILKDLQSQQVDFIQAGDTDGFDRVTAQIQATEAAIESLSGSGKGGLGVTDSLQAARGSSEALRGELQALSDQLNKAAPTRNTDSIRDQIQAVNREISELELRRLGIDVELNATADPAELTDITNQIRRVKDELEASRVFIDIGTNADAVQEELAATQQRVESLQAQAGVLETIQLNVTEGNTSGVLESIRDQVEAFSRQIEEQEVYVNILGNTGGTASEIQAVEDEIVSLRDTLGTLRALEVQINSGDAVDALKVVEERAQAVRDSLQSQQVRIDILANAGESAATIDAVRERVEALQGDLRSLEAAEIKINSGDSAQIIQGITDQIGVLQGQIQAAQLQIPSVEIDPEGFNTAQSELAELQTRLDVLQGYRLELDGKDLVTLESQLQAVNDALRQVPASNPAYQQLSEQARTLADEINQVKVFRVVTDVDANLEGLEERLDVLRERLRDAPEGQYFPGLVAQIEETKRQIEALKPAIETIELPTITPAPIVFPDPTPPDFSGVVDAVKAANASLIKEAGNLQEVIDGALNDAFRGLASGAGQVFEKFGQAIGNAIRTGQGAADAFAGLFQNLIRLILVEVPKLIGTFLIQTGVGLGFPAGLPFIITGVGLVGLSGLLGGLLGGGRSGQQQVATPSQVAAQGLTGGQLPGQGLGTFNAEDREQDFVVNLDVILDADGIEERLERRLIRSERAVRGR